MTTATPLLARRSAARVLVGAAGAAVVAGLVVVVVAALSAGSDAVLGALAGAVLTVVVLATGAMVVDVVADLMPTMSLLVALMTYTLQLVLLGLLLLGLDRSDAASDALSAAWLGGAMIAGCLAWTAAQVRLATTARVPLYDLPDTGAGSALEGSER